MNINISMSVSVLKEQVINCMYRTYLHFYDLTVKNLLLKRCTLLSWELLIQKSENNYLN